MLECKINQKSDNRSDKMKWNIKIYDNEGQERETIYNLSYDQYVSIELMLHRLNIRYEKIEVKQPSF